MPRPHARTIERTRLVDGRSVPSYDPEVLEIIGTLAAPSPGGTLRFIGVADEFGHIYRRIALFCPMEMLVCRAKLNAAGFNRHSGVRGGMNNSYECVYLKRSR